MTAAAEVRPTNRELRLQGLVHGRPALGPHTVHFDIANACNTRCTTCWHHSPLLESAHVPSAQWKRQRMSLADFTRLLDDLIGLGGLEEIILSGMGDPTLNPELAAMVEHAHRRDIGVTIITNLLKADLPRLLASPGRLQLLTSICGVTERVWQAFHAHPSPGGFHQLMTQLAHLRRADFRPKHVQVINAQNVAQLPAMVRFAAAWPVARVNFKLASLARGTERHALTQAQRAALTDELIPAARALATRLGVTTDLDAFEQQARAHDTHRTAPIEDVGCYMGHVYARITVDQELLFCCNTRVSAGFITPETPPSALWRSAGYQSLRDAVSAGRYFQGCDQCGKFKQNLKWRQRLDAWRARGRPAPTGP